MRIVVVGGGGREHALAWALHRGGEHEIIAVPGNPGTAPFCRNIEGDPVTISVEESADLVVVGPEAPLVAGISEELSAAGIPCFGPDRVCAGLEGSKWFAKEVMESAGVPTAQGRLFTDPVAAVDYLGEYPEMYVIKADGLAAGKGVFLPRGKKEAEAVIGDLFTGSLGEAGASVVVEQRLVGREVSVMAVCSGTEAVMLPPSRDHKRAFDGDNGPNTGGMGAVCPPPDVPPGFGEEIRERVVLPVLREMEARGHSFRGVLYAGLMITEYGPMVLEFNVRFGDPETQAVLPMIETDLAPLFLSAATGGKLSPVTVRQGACACVILASGGYPGAYEKGVPITGTETVDCLLFHAGTAGEGEDIRTSGGRVLGVTAPGPDLETAIDSAYRNAEKIVFSGKHMRKDIGRTI